jgi:hypothetical protein
MKNLFLSIALILTCTGIINAQLLWEIKGNNLTSPSYIVGTHHVAPVGFQDSIPGFNKAINAVEQVYGEIDMVNPGAMDMATIQQYTIAPADSTIDKFLTPAQLDSIATTLGKYMGQQIPVAALSGVRPAAINAQLAMLQSMKAFPGFNPQMQFDTMIQQIAKQAGKKTGGLETMIQQLQMLYGAPIAEQAQDLLKSVRHDDLAIAKAQELADAYRRGDLSAIEKALTDPEFGMTPTEADRMLYERNAAWVNFLIGALPTSSMLIAVGVGHLPGEKGVISLLRKAGFEVNPVEE